jgi:hypothetical protein
MSILGWIRNQSLPLQVRRGIKCTVDCGGTSVPYSYVPFESLVGDNQQEWASAVRQAVFPGANPERTELEQRIRPAQETSTEVVKLDNGNLEMMGLRGCRVQWPRQYTWADGQTTDNLRAIAQVASYRWDRIADWDLDILAFAIQQLHAGMPNRHRELLVRWGVEDRYISPETGRTFPAVPSFGLSTYNYAISRVRTRVDLLEFRPEFAPDQDTTLTVRFSHLIDNDISQPDEANGHRPGMMSHQFQYILKTARNWRHFGPIHLTVRLPNEARRATSIPLKRVSVEGSLDVLEATLDGQGVNQNLLIGLRMPFGTPASNPDVN